MSDATVAAVLAGVHSVYSTTIYVYFNSCLSDWLYLNWINVLGKVHLTQFFWKRNVQLSDIYPTSSPIVTEGVLSFRDLPSLTLRAGPQICVFQSTNFYRDFHHSALVGANVCRTRTALLLWLGRDGWSQPLKLGFTRSHLCVGVGGAASSTRTDPLPNTSVFPCQ
jgi:hypothetical protein